MSLISGSYCLGAAVVGPAAELRAAIVEKRDLDLDCARAGDENLRDGAARSEAAGEARRLSESAREESRRTGLATDMLAVNRESESWEA